MTTLVTWSDRSLPGQYSPEDRGPICRLLEQPEFASRYREVWLLSTAGGAQGAAELERELSARGLVVEVRRLNIPDPTDHGDLFRALTPVVEALKRRGEPLDVNLSAGTPQMQTLWVILVQAGLLRARMLQVIPPGFVPTPHPRAVRDVELDIDGFPEIRALRAEVNRLRSASLGARGNLVGSSEPMQELGRIIGRVARANVPVLIHGETGTGKELVARALHERSLRSEGPFVAENCGAFSDGVLASELFGHEAGAFTGARERRRGLLELAHGGTLFLDEVGEMTSRLQVSLLRVLDEGTLRRVGAERVTRVDVRVLAATHRNLREQVERGEFREDLYYRLRGATVEVPPLRGRGKDLEQLVQYFSDADSPAPTREAWQALRQYDWPGNVRELRAEVTRWSVFCRRRVTPQDLSPEIRGNVTSSGQLVSDSPDDRRSLAERVAELEHQVIAGVLDREGHNLSRSAKSLEIDRNTLKRKIAALGIPHENRGSGRPVDAIPAVDPDA